MIDPQRIKRILGPRVLLNRLPLPEQTRGGIYLIGREYPTLARVAMVGNEQASAQLREGDEVYFNTFDWGKWAFDTDKVGREWAIFPVKNLYVRLRMVNGVRIAYPLNNFALVRRPSNGSDTDG